jgi:hypothetical protein
MLHEKLVNSFVAGAVHFGIMSADAALRRQCDGLGPAVREFLGDKDARKK